MRKSRGGAPSAGRLSTDCVEQLSGKFLTEHHVIVSIPELGQVLGENRIGLGLALKRDGRFESDLLH
jgi:hypothetical protein